MPSRPLRRALPAPAAQRIGRELELAAVQSLLKRPTVRLITLTGPGGVGKTRLALEAAGRVAANYADDVHFISLAPILDWQLAVPTIALSLGVPEAAERTALHSLSAHLEFQHTLLVLDNLEQILPAAPQLAELLAACPSLQVLATSRARLQLSGEHEFPVTPLATSAPGSGGSLDDIARLHSVQLFCARAQAIKPGFQLNSANAAAVAEICRRLDGLPLALELAAARVKLLPPAAMLTRWSSPLPMLAGGPRDAPPRHQSLSDTLAWSYNLLELSEQRLFRRLGIFVGGCSLEALEAVACLPGELPLDVLSQAGALVDKSLLLQEELPDGEPRLTMLETTRQYALEQLRAIDSEAVVRKAHAEYYAQLAKRAEPHLGGSEQEQWLAALEREHNNLRAALRWQLDTSRAPAALELAGALWRFWFARGYMREGRQWLEQALKLSGDTQPVAPAARIKALSGASVLAANQGDYAAARTYGAQGLQLCRQAHDDPGAAAALIGLGNVSIWTGDYDEACRYLEESVALHRALQDPAGTARALAYLANAHWFAGREPEATRHFEGALAHYQSTRDAWGQGFTLYGLGFTALSREDFAVAGEHFLQAEKVLLPIGDKRGLVRVYWGLGRLELERGRMKPAQDLALKAFALTRDLGERWGLNVHLDALAGLAAALHRPEVAARLYSAGHAAREALGVPLPRPFALWREPGLAIARAALDESTFAAAWAEGRQLSPEQALAHFEQIVILPAPPALPEPLTPRELEVLQLVAEAIPTARLPNGWC